MELVYPIRKENMNSVAVLQERFSTVYPQFLELLISEAKLFEAKNHDYASGGKVTGNFDRVSSILSHYPDFPFASPQGVAIIYMLKQLDSIMWGLCQKTEYKVEGLRERAQDISVYAKLLQIMGNTD